MLGTSRITMVTFSFWVVTAVLIGAIEALDGGPAMEGFHDGLALFAAGLTSAALVYLLVEHEARPLVAAALGGRPPARTTTLGLRPRLLLSWALGSGVPLVVLIGGEWSIGPDDPRLSGKAAVVLALIGLVIGASMSRITARSVAEPIGAVRQALSSVQGGDLSVVLAVDDGGEVGQLQAGVNRMVAGLRERERLATSSAATSATRWRGGAEPKASRSAASAGGRARSSWTCGTRRRSPPARRRRRSSRCSTGSSRRSCGRSRGGWLGQQVRGRRRAVRLRRAGVAARPRQPCAPRGPPAQRCD